MRFSQILATAALGVAQAAATDAPVVQGNPAGLTALATLPEDPFWTEGSLDGNVKGFIKATSGPNGVGVDYEANFSNLPSEGGPFSYHIHVAPVPESGNCTDTLAHLDPYERGEEPSCDSSAPETCQVGDLSGKYGKVEQSAPGAPFIAKYHDPYSSLIEGQGSFFGNRSFVFHFGNKTRISCANFEVYQETAPSSTCPPGVPSPTGTGVIWPTPTGTSTVPIGAAGALKAVSGLAVVPVLAWLAL